MELTKELREAIANVQGFLAVIDRPLRLGDVVKCKKDIHDAKGLPTQVGVVVGIDAPETMDDPWSYAVLFPDLEDPMDSETIWLDVDQIEVVQPYISKPIVASVGVEEVRPGMVVMIGEDWYRIYSSKVHESPAALGEMFEPVKSQVYIGRWAEELNAGRTSQEDTTCFHQHGYQVKILL